MKTDVSALGVARAAQRSVRKPATGNRRPAGHECGLATLEMVLVLPLFLLIMALMVNYGTIAAWKVRALGVARHAAWGTRAPRGLTGTPQDDFWPGSRSYGGAARMPEIDDPRVDQPVARGPVLPSGTRVYREVLDPSRGLHRGASELRRVFPMLQSLGNFHVESHNLLVGDKFQYWQMSWGDGQQRRGVWSNEGRRMPVLYALAQAPAALAQAYVNAVMALVRSPLVESLWPLDMDREWIDYHHRLGLGWPPDFHPHLHPFCSRDHVEVSHLVDRLCEQIKAVPRRMAQAFLRMYQTAQQRLRAQLRSQPPPPPGQRGAIEAEIEQLQQKIDILTVYVNQLP